MCIFFDRRNTKVFRGRKNVQAQRFPQSVLLQKSGQVRGFFAPKEIQFCCKNGSECAFSSTDGILRYFEGEKMCRHDAFRNRFCCKNRGRCVVSLPRRSTKVLRAGKKARRCLDFSQQNFRNKKTATLLGGCFLLVLATTYLPGR